MPALPGQAARRAHVAKASRQLQRVGKASRQLLRGHRTHEPAAVAVNSPPRHQPTASTAGAHRPATLPSRLSAPKPRWQPAPRPACSGAHSGGRRLRRSCWISAGPTGLEWCNFACLIWYTQTKLAISYTTCCGHLPPLTFGACPQRRTPGPGIHTDQVQHHSTPPRSPAGATNNDCVGEDCRS